MIRLPFRFAASLFLVLLVLRLPSAQTQSANTLPADLAEFVSQTQEKLKDGDLAAVRAVGVSPEVLSWLEPPAPAKKIAWKLAAMPLPTGNQKPEYVAVFYDFHTCESVGDHVHNLVKAGGAWRFGPEIPETDTRGYRVSDHKLTVRYDLPANACSITDDVTVERTEPGDKLCLLRLSSDMQIDRAVCATKPFSERHVPGLIAFQAPAEKTFTLTLAYHGTVNHPGSDYIRTDEAVLVSYWYPHIARLPAKSAVTATVPKGWTAVGQGDLIKRVDDEDNSTFTFRNEIPNCVFSLDAGPYVITSRQVGGRKLSAYLLKPDETRANQCLDLLTKALSFFEKSYTPFPYTHYETVETNGPFSGALEAYSFATFARNALPGTIPHELSHTWWGGIVPNPYTRTMWNESFANYSDGLFRRQTVANPPPKALHGLHQDKDRGRALIQLYRVPIAQAFDTENNSHNIVGYGKGSQVMDMLEDELGTGMMIRCLRRFLEDHRAGEAADWPDFEEAVKKTTGKSYAWFFDQWLNRGGLPVLRLANVKRGPQGGGWVVTGEIVQEGMPYRLRIPIQVSDGDRTIDSTVETAGPTTPFRITSPTEPRAVQLDPVGNILMAGAKTDDGSDPFAVQLAL